MGPDTSLVVVFFSACKALCIRWNYWRHRRENHNFLDICLLSLWVLIIPKVLVTHIQQNATPVDFLLHMTVDCFISWKGLFCLVKEETLFMNTFYVVIESLGSRPRQPLIINHQSMCCHDIHYSKVTICFCLNLLIIYQII